MSNKKQNGKPIKETKTAGKNIKESLHKDKSAEKKIPENKLAVIITAISLAVITVCASAFFLVDAIINNKFFNYLTSDLSKYVTLSEDDYKNYTIEVDIAKPRDIDADVAILALLASDKGEAKYNGEEVTSHFTVMPGAELNIWYRGYILDNDGGKIEATGMSNLSGNSPSKLEIGSGSFIPGFELGLVGINTADYPRFVKITDNTTDIVESHIAYVSFSRLVEGGNKDNDTSKVVSVRIDLSGDKIDKNFGEGFKEKILGATIGEKMTFSAVIDGKTYNYTDVTVDYVTECENNSENPPIIVEAYFPYDYSTTTLRNETAYFEVYIDSGVLYEEQKFDDEYVEKLVKREGSKITLDELNVFEGAALTDKYRTYVKKTIDEIYKEEYESAVREAAWDHILSRVKVIKYPESKVKEMYKEYIEGVEDQFEETGGYIANQYTGGYTTYQDIDSFARAYLGLGSSTNWKNYLYSMSESLVKERLAMYYIIRKENLKPGNKEFKAIIEEEKQMYLDEYVQQSLDYEKKTREDFATEEEYEDYVKDRASELFGYYNDDYFEETTLYNIASEQIIKWPTVITLDERLTYPVDK